MVITDQVATAPCTDPIQECFPTFEAKLGSIALPQSRIAQLLLLKVCFGIWHQ